VRCFKWLALCWVSTAALAQQPADTRVSGTSFLSKQLQALQADKDRHPAQLWTERGQGLFQAQCVSCHTDLASLKKAVASYPKLNASGKLVNIEDQLRHRAEQGGTALTDDDVLTLSAALHDASKGEVIRTQPVQPHYDNGKALWNTRMGRINLACAHCHDDQFGKVGSQMRADTISQGHPTGFPIYRLSWQSLGTLERRLRACYSGVQAPLPAIGSLELRELELFLKVRASRMVIEGASIRR
jgi:L-cysteine S-thiosulfotransferase